jgi:hypothetical protein
MFAEELRQRITTSPLGEHHNCGGLEIEVTTDREGEFDGYELICACGETFITENND